MDHAGTKITSFGSPPKSISKQHSAAALAPSPSAIRKTGTKNHQSLQTSTSTAYQSLEIDGVSSNENNNIMLNEIMNGGEMNRDDVAMVEVDQLELADGATTSNAEQVEGENDLEEEETKPPLHIEVRLKAMSKVRYDLIRKIMWTHIDAEYFSLLKHSEIWDWMDVDSLAENVERVWVGECSMPTAAVNLDAVQLHIHVYQPPLASNVTEFSTSSSNPEENDGESDVMAASVLDLPSRSLEGVWDSLIYDGDVKGKLLGYIYSTLLFSDAMVDFNIVTWNRVVLLHGPPGTGKTSLCRALAQKLSIRLSDRYEHGKLIEINSHSLFSKWFSESGKLVQRLFAAVTEMVDDESGFLVVLIDEVESLTAARAGAMSGKEPSDALRVVNALLTQLDKLKHRKNCLVMTTSNLSAAIDGAFIDRADIKQYIGLPPAQAVYWILHSCLKEIVRAKLIAPITLDDWESINIFRESGSTSKEESRRCSSLLYDLAFDCHGMSGRTLRRLPVLAHARHMSNAAPGTGPIKMRIWLEAMKKCVQEEGDQMDKIDGI